MVVIISLLFTVMALAQKSAEDLIKKHFRAIGGKERVESLVSVKRTGTIEFPDYRQPQPKGSGFYQTLIVYPDRVRIQIKVGAYQLDQIRNKNQYWDFDGKNFKVVMDSVKKEELNDTSLKANRELLWWENEHQSIQKTVTPEFVSNSRCIAGIKNTSKDFICFDKGTDRLKASGNQTEYRFYRDWKKAGDIKMPFHIDHYRNGLLSYSIKLDSVEVNKNILDSEFAP